MGIPMPTSSFPTQVPLDSSVMHTGKLRAWWGEKKKYQSEEVEPCIKVDAILDEAVCVDEKGQEMLDESGNKLLRSLFIGKFTPSASEKSNCFKIHKTLFKEKMTPGLWADKYADGDLWIAMVNGQPVSVMASDPDFYDPVDPGKYFQTADKIVGFVPNPNPDVTKNPPPRDIHNQVIEDPGF